MAELHAAGKTVMVQPYIDAVDEEGELALIFLGGRFSHAVRKEALLVAGSGPATGLYLEETMNASEASRLELEIAEQALDAIPFPARACCTRASTCCPGRSCSRSN